MAKLFLIIGIAFVLSCVPALLLFVRSYWRFRGKRVITCPETKASAAVELDAAHAAATATFGFGEPDFRLQSCSRWPQRQGCGQECLAEIEAAPEECLVKRKLTAWYEGSSCVLCGRELGKIQWYDREPALMSPQKKSVGWEEIPPEQLPQVLATHFPLCFDCHVTESFRVRFPERVVEDPWHRARRPNEKSRRPA